MAGLLEYAAKYLPELEKLSKNEAGDGQSQANPDQVLRSLKRSATEMKSPQHGGPQAVGTQRRRRPATAKSTRLNKYGPYPSMVPPPFHGPPPYPVNPHFMPTPVPFMGIYPPSMSIQQFRPKYTPTKGRKTGPVLKNVTNALADFQKKRDKFLNYLAQLQYDLIRINLPSASKEKINVKYSKESNKRKKKVVKPKAKKAKENKDISTAINLTSTDTSKSKSEMTESTTTIETRVTKKSKPKDSIFT